MDLSKFLKAHTRAHTVAAAPRSQAGAGSRMRIHAPQTPRRNRKAGLVATALGLLLALGLGAALLMLRASADVCFMATAVAGLASVIVHEIVTRRQWEGEISEKLEITATGQQLLAREISRNGHDIDVLKDGLADTAAALEAQAKRLPAAAASIETRMLNLIAERLGNLGRKPLPKPAAANMDHIVELEMAPPPLQAPPETRLERAMAPRTGKFSDKAISDMVRRAVLHDRIEVFVQPVVALPQRRVRMVELLARVPTSSGHFLPAERYLKVAANDSMLPAIDDLLLLQCLDSLADHRHPVPDDLCCMLNIDAATLRDTGFLNDLVTFLGRNRAIGRQLVFELPQAELDALDPKILPVMEGLSKLGCRFSMDRVRRRRLNIEQMKRQKIRFLKMDAAWLVHEAGQRGGAARINQLKAKLNAAGIDLIVERIENEATLRDLFDFNIDFGQGYLFGKPEPWSGWVSRQLKQKAGRAA
jgi:cyclic-di-GMP phosphodiesterase TipF (flagellum assembly factor)